MRLLYGEDLIADLAPGTRYDLVAAALGVHGELVRDPAELGPALDRALAHPGPALVNVLTDPADAYPRRSNLA
jgi:acetolactate synthase-1/2/3 large subunit